MPSNLPAEDRRPDQSKVAKDRPTTDLRKLNKKFVSTLLRDFNRNGDEALEAFREKNPDKYCQLVASFIPREQTLNVNSKSETNVQVNHSLDHTARLLQEMAKRTADDGNVIELTPEEPDSYDDY